MCDFPRSGRPVCFPVLYIRDLRWCKRVCIVGTLLAFSVGESRKRSHLSAKQPARTSHVRSWSAGEPAVQASANKMAANKASSLYLL